MTAHTAGRFQVYSPMGSEILAEFPYADAFSKGEAKRKADDARLQWKARGYARVGVRHVKAVRP